jgi:hypothetical protein
MVWTAEGINGVDDRRSSNHPQAGLVRFVVATPVLVGGVLLVAAGFMPWAHFGPGVHTMIAVCVLGSGCGPGFPSPQYLLIALGITAVISGARHLVALPAARQTNGRVVALAAVVVVGGADTWYIQGAYRRLAMEIHDPGWFLGPAGVVLCGVGVVWSPWPLVGGGWQWRWCQLSSGTASSR